MTYTLGTQIESCSIANLLAILTRRSCASSGCSAAATRSDWLETVAPGEAATPCTARARPPCCAHVHRDLPKVKVEDRCAWLFPADRNTCSNFTQMCTPHTSH